MEQKEIEEFLIRFGGAMTGALEDAAMEGYFKANLWVQGRGVFPYTQLHAKLPPNDDLIVGGLAIPPWVIGALLEEDAKKKGDTKAAELGKNVKMFGEGDVIYSANMIVHHTVIRLPEPPWTYPPEQQVAAGRGAGGSPGQRTDVGHRIIKL